MSRGNIQFHHGRKANPKKDVPFAQRTDRIKVTGRLFTTTTIPDKIDYGTKVKTWPMYLNDQLGDCGPAGAGHLIQAVSTYGQGNTITITDDDVLKVYEAVGGYVPGQSSTDSGVVLQDLLSYWRKTGIAGHKILAFAEIDPSDIKTARAALYHFGGLYIGINFPGSAMDQFNQGKPWDVVKGARIEGGHCIFDPINDNSSAEPWDIVTWGELQEMTQAFWDAYVEEVWVVITPEWFDAQGHSPEGVDLYTIGEDFAALTGESNPFPEPQPTPEPTPTPSPQPTPQPAPTPDPTPTPTPGSVDQALADALHEWLEALPRYYKTVQNAASAWLQQKGL